MRTLYNIFIALYGAAISLVGVWNKKAREWTKGRKTLFKDLEHQLSPSDQVIWMHCASAGELEQGKPVLERLKELHPDYKILVSFFSPSGYASGKKYKGADVICYLPLDTRANAEKFLKLVHPKLVVFVKYEYWYHHLKAVHNRHIPLLLISSIFRTSQVFFKSYGNFYRNILKLFTWIFVQDEQSAQLLESIQVSHRSVSGDTRFDRVAVIAAIAPDLPLIQRFAENHKVLVAGSTWPDDENILAESIGSMGQNIKTIIAPHEINKEHIEHILSRFPDAIQYSKAEAATLGNFNTLIIDNVGMLSRLYHYATITYIGGGFNKSGIHNTLEAAVWGKPVVFGPQFQKFKEARDLVSRQAAFSFTNANQLTTILTTLLQDQSLLRQSSQAAKNYVEESRGATDRIISYIQENRLLTR